MASSLTIEGVNASYGLVRVIEDVSLNVKAGETVTLLGTNWDPLESTCRHASLSIL